MGGGGNSFVSYMDSVLTVDRRWVCSVEDEFIGCGIGWMDWVSFGCQLGRNLGHDYRWSIDEISSRIFWNSRVIEEEFSDIISSSMGDGVAWHFFVVVWSPRALYTPSEFERLEVFCRWWFANRFLQDLDLFSAGVEDLRSAKGSYPMKDRSRAWGSNDWQKKVGALSTLWISAAGIDSRTDRRQRWWRGSEKRECSGRSPTRQIDDDSARTEQSRLVAVRTTSGLYPFQSKRSCQAIAWRPHRNRISASIPEFTREVLEVASQ